MAAITQQVPNYIFGISEQPDELKIPGQVRDLKNALPDVTRGLQKRPGTNYLNNLSTSTGGKWFSYYRDSSEQYIGQVIGGTVKMWDALTGTPKTVTGSVGSYLSASDPEDIQLLTVNDFTYITNRTKTVRMAGDKSPAAKYQAFISLKQIKPGTQYALDISSPGSGVSHTFKRATAIEIADRPYDTSSEYPEDGKCSYAARQLFKAGNDVWFEIDSRCIPSGPEPEDGGDGKSYWDVYTDTATLKFGGQNSGVGSTYTVTMRNSKKDAGWIVRVTEDVEVKATANICLVRPEVTPFEGLGATADSILTGCQNIINSNSSVNCTQIGSGLYLEANFPFVVTSPDETLFTIIQDSAEDVSKLPSSCLDGYIVKIANSGEEADDYYVKFIGDNGNGSGVWEETIKPNLDYKVDESTMPVMLKRTSSGNFELSTIDWTDRLVGDNLTNPKLSYIDNKINKMIFFRNRLGFIVGENVVLSKAGDFYNFWQKSATTVIAVDPIDISCSAQTPAIIRDSLEVNAGLLLWAESQQFILTTDSDSFEPKTAKINFIASYSYNIRTSPMSMGTTVGFINNGQQYTRFFEMVGVTRDTEPTVIEQSKLVSRLIPRDYEELAVSKENSFVALGKNTSNEIWVYRYFNSGDKRVQSAWVRWELPGNVLYHTIMDDIYYAVLDDGSVSLQSIGIRPNDTFDSQDKTVYLDRKLEYSVDELSFDKKSNSTSFTIPEEYLTAPSSKAFSFEYGNKLGRFSDVTVEGNVVSVNGDWTAEPLTLGDGYEMVVEFPTIFPQQKQGDSVRSDIRSSLVVQRIKLNLEDTNIYETVLSRRGKADYTKLHESTQADSYRADATPFNADRDQTISVYERNTNVNLTLISDYPCACTLLSMNWEGDYNPRYYKSV